MGYWLSYIPRAIRVGFLKREEKIVFIKDKISEAMTGWPNRESRSEIVYYVDIAQNMYLGNKSNKEYEVLFDWTLEQLKQWDTKK